MSILVGNNEAGKSTILEDIQNSLLHQPKPKEQKKG
ncbi:MAG: AAA family ATPase [Campylobacterales bacterium]|nr:AAA family ATPase [Campylobacterales bacterium]